jgi:hypothetical protein
MRGDPAAGGAIDNISRNVGIIGPEAGVFDSSGNFYFVSLTGFYRMAGDGSAVEQLSRGKLDKVFRELNPAENLVRLVYDARWQGVHIFINTVTQPSTAPTHYWWDERTDSFWPDRYPIAVGPTAMHSFDADDPTMSAVLLGGYDGYIRAFDEDAETDDGTDITSFVRFSPLVPGQIAGSARLDDIHVVLDQQSGPVTLKLWTGDTVEEAERLADLDGTPAFKRTLVGGRNSTIRNRRAANAFLIELSQTEGNKWAFEGGLTKVQVLNRLRGRHVS